MTTPSPVVTALNTMVTIELTVINQYYLHAKICDHWGYAKLAAKLREISMEEMRDADAYAQRVLEVGGLPNFQRIDPFGVGENPVEMITLARDAEKHALEALRTGIQIADEHGDMPTAQMFREAALEEREHLAWAETQLLLRERLGESDFLTTLV